MKARKMQEHDGHPTTLLSPEWNVVTIDVV